MDIVERLRASEAPLGDEAAAEIERLRHTYRDITPEQAEAIRKFHASMTEFKKHYG